MRLCQLHAQLANAKVLDFFAPVADLLLRLYLAQVFFLSGLSKIRDWDNTLFLFANEYQVPFLPPHIAALFGTAAELVLPVLLALGLLSRGAAIGLFALNIVAVLSYYAVLKDVPGALQDHFEWGLMLLVLISNPIRCLSLDRLIQRYANCRNSTAHS